MTPELEHLTRKLNRGPNRKEIFLSIEEIRTYFGKDKTGDVIEDYCTKNGFYFQTQKKGEDITAIISNYELT